MELIYTVRLKVALNKKDQTEEYTFSRSWTAPSTGLRLSAGRLALKNITFVVADDQLESEDLFVCLPVLQHLRFDTKTLLEDNIEVLNGTDCNFEVHERKEGTRKTWSNYRLPTKLPGLQDFPDTSKPSEGQLPLCAGRGRFVPRSSVARSGRLGTA